VAWIESHTVLLRHRKLIELSKDLRLKPVYVMGHLHALWHAALEQQEDGDLSSWSDELIAELASYPGDAPQFVRLLQQHKWLDGKIIHDWLDCAGKYLHSKYRNSNPRKLKDIYKKHKSVLRPSKDRLKTDRLPRLPRLPDLTLPNQQDLTKEKEKEKRAYGEFHRVLLTDSERQKLVDRLGESVAESGITDLDLGLQSKPAYRKKYTDHYATILSWNRRKDIAKPSKSKADLRLDEMFKNLNEAFPKKPVEAIRETTVEEV